MNIAKSFFNSAFIRHNAVLFFGSMLVGLGNYIYYPVLARMMQPAPFGEVQALAALFTQLSLFLIVLGQVTVNIVANYSDEEKKQRVLFELEKFAFILSIALALVLAAFSWKLKAFFQFESVAPFILLLVAVVVSVPLAFRSAYLRAHKKFASVSVAQIIGAFSKVFLSAALVLIGFKSAGAMGGIVVSQILAFGYAAYKAKQLGFFKPKGSSYRTKPDMQIMVPELKYAMLVFVGSLAVTLLSSIDVFVVKHYFDPHTAGEYAAISTVAKIIFFLTGSISQVMLPSVKLNQTSHENFMYFLKSLVLLSGIGGVAVIIFTAMSRTMVHILMGSNYLAYAHFLPQLSLAMFLLSIVGLLISYYLALRKYQLTAIVGLGIITIGWLMVARHASLQDVVTNLVWSALCILGYFGAWRLIAFVKRRSQINHV